MKAGTLEGFCVFQRCLTGQPTEKGARGDAYDKAHRFLRRKLSALSARGERLG